MPNTITDIWFVTDRSLEEIATLIPLSDPDYDGESYWSWVVGDFHGYQLDITRTHRIPAEQTPTRLFLADAHGPIPDKIVEAVLVSLLWSGIRPIRLGQWQYLRGNDYDMQVARTVGHSPSEV